MRSYGTCPTDYSVDSEDDTFCVRTACWEAGYVDRTENAQSWVAGLDPLVPSHGGYSQLDIGDREAFKFGQWGGSHPEHLDNVTKLGFVGLDYWQLVHLATLDNVQYGGEMSELDDAGTYFDMPVHKVSGKGTYHYLCTRNNNFSNRSQKGKIVVSDAPEGGRRIGSNGGVVSMDTSQKFTVPHMDPEDAFAAGEFAILFPENALPEAMDVQVQVIPSSSGAGMSDAASDVLWIGPEEMQTRPVFSTMELASSSARRDADDAGIWADLTIVNTTAVWYKVWGWEEGSVPTSLTFQWSSGSVELTDMEVTAENAIEGVWAAMEDDSMEAVKQGEMWLILELADTEYRGLAAPKEGTGSAAQVKMPVSVSMTYGRVYRWPDTTLGRQCVLENPNLPGCSYAREEVCSSCVSGGEAEFSVQRSGYYQVSSGSNLPIIVGVTAACLVVVLAAVGSAMYFRKHPDKFEAFKAWGPRQYRAIKRSLSKQI